jgi:hypothetical protein
MAHAAFDQAYLEQRAATRHTVSFRSVLLECDVFGEHVDVINIARLGFLARTRLHRDTGEELRIHLPDLGTLRADVVWCANGMLGGRFHDAIDERSFTEFLERLART